MLVPTLAWRSLRNRAVLSGLTVLSIALSVALLAALGHAPDGDAPAVRVVIERRDKHLNGAVQIRDRCGYVFDDRAEQGTEVGREVVGRRCGDERLRKIFEALNESVAPAWIKLGKRVVEKEYGWAPRAIC